MKNVIKSVYGLMVLLVAMCFMAGCKAEIKYVDKVIEKTYVSPVVFTTVDAGEKGVTITMVTATEGAVIYYTEDGSTPTASSTVYSSAVTYSTDKTLKAIAVKTGMENSPISSVSVSVKTKIVTDTVTKYICPKCEKEYSTAEAAANCCGVQYKDKTYASPVVFTVTDAGDSGVTITMASSTEGAVIYYTEDGSTPTVSSTVYSSAVTYSSDKTLKAIAVKSGIENSPVSSVSVTIKTKTVTNTVYTSAVATGTYNVYHFQQKTSGGKAFADYTLTAADSSKAVAANTTIETLKKTYAGFTAKAMAQNETAIYIFYDRNTITYTFETGSEGKFSDGTTERIVKGLYGAPVSTPIVTSSTHNFGGWYTSSNDAVPSTYGEEDLTFTVKWTAKAAGGFNWYDTPVDAETGNTATASSTYIYFGVFPKTVLASDSAISVDETETKTMGANTYYKGNDGNWYAKVTENCYGSSGYTYTDGTTVKQSSASSTRYFKVEPIKWKVLTTDYNGTKNALLLAEDILTANVPYYVSTSNRTIGGNTVYTNNYKYSTIRAYLNGKYESDDTQSKTAYADKGFLQTAFTSSAQLLITETEVNNAAETTGYSESTYATTYACDDTTDKIFLLSESEVINSAYGFASYSSYGKGNARIRVTTDYAKANYAYQSTTTGYGGFWWLRSPSYNFSSFARNVNYDGYALTSRDVGPTITGVVPALSISLQ